MPQVRRFRNPGFLPGARARRSTSSYPRRHRTVGSLSISRCGRVALVSWFPSTSPATHKLPFGSDGCCANEKDGSSRSESGHRLMLGSWRSPRGRSAGAEVRWGTRRASARLLSAVAETDRRLREGKLSVSYIPIACVRVPALPIAAHHGTVETAPLGIDDGERVLFVDATAYQRGIRPGQRIAAAKARDASLRLLPHDPRRIRRARRWVVARLLELSPRVTADSPRKARSPVQTPHLTRFWAEPHQHDRGWQTWASSVRGALRRLAPVSIGVGPDATTAFAAACPLREGSRVVSRSEARDFLDRAPLDVLDIGQKAKGTLATLGVRTVGELRLFDVGSLAVRFGAEVAEARRRAEGRDVRGPRRGGRPLQNEVQVTLDDPITRRRELDFLLRPAVDRLARRIRNADRGITELRLRLRLCEAEDARIDVAFGEPCVSPSLLMELLAVRLDRAQALAPIRGFTLRAHATVPHARQSESMPHAGCSAADPRVAVARIQSRLGSDSVKRATRVERSHPLARAAWVVERLDGAPFDPVAGEALPWRTLDQPEPLREGFVRVAGQRRRVVRLSRVERVSRPCWSGEHDALTELIAWAELEGPVPAIVRGRFAPGREDRWEVIAWLD